jgi:hypothetical protein
VIDLFPTLTKATLVSQHQLIEKHHVVIAETADFSGNSSAEIALGHRCDHGSTPFISRPSMDPWVDFGLWKLP